MRTLLVVLVAWQSVVVTKHYRVPGPARAHRDVTTTQGVVRGYKVDEPPHYEFLGVPYGGPPTAEDRFKPPQMPLRWDGIFEATHRVSCPQPDGEGDENCLVVNVFAPEHTTSVTLPVMVHLHDGGFYSGWGSFEPPPRLLLQGILVVTLNYRLGALGFLCLGVPDAPGNAGFKDQVTALYWIHRNIHNFGGDPNDVTVYGTGSGATGAQFLILSPVFRGLFHKAILESGSALSPSSLSYYDHSAVAKDVASMLQHTSDSDSIEELVEFYQLESFRNLANFSKSFRPCIEGESSFYNSLIERDPLEILKSGQIQDIPILFIYTDQEVLTMLDEIPDEWHSKPDPHWLEILPSNIEIVDEVQEHQVIQTIIEMYFPKEEDDDQYVKGYVNLYSDIYISYPVTKSALLHAWRNTKPVYLMKFSFEGELSNQKAEAISGAGHGDVANYIFSKIGLQLEDEQIAERLIHLWTNFIKIGDPTPLISLLTPVIWQPIPSDSMSTKRALMSTQYLEVGTDMQLHKKTIDIHLQFWDKVYLNFHKPYLNNIQEDSLSAEYSNAT